MVKIFIGLNDVASQISDLKICFRKLGVDTLTAIHSNPYAIIKGRVDYNFSDYQRRYFERVRPTRLQLYLRDRFDICGKIKRRAMRECDAFIFLWDSFNYDFSDYRVLKRKGKKIISVFCGDDVRWYPAHEQEFRKYGLLPIEYDNFYDHSVRGLEKRLLRLRTAERYSDFIFSRLDQAQLALRPYYRWNMMVMPEQYGHHPVQREHNPVVAHAPSSRKFKGTRYVLEVFDQLKKDGVPFTVRLIENVPNEKAVEMYTDADMLIDQVLCPGAGKLATEALTSGTIVLSHMAYDRYPQKNPAECPIVDVNPQNLYDQLKSLVLDYPRRRELAARGRPYVMKYLDVEIFCKKVVNLLSGDEQACDYTPEFFRDEFIPESKEACVVYNNWTETLRDCDWYKKDIRPGKRAGLKF